MSEIINLRQKRKQVSRAEKRKSASENAAKYGLSKAEKTLQEARRLKAARMLDGVKRDV